MLGHDAVMLACDGRTGPSVSCYHREHLEGAWRHVRKGNRIEAWHIDGIHPHFGVISAPARWAYVSKRRTCPPQRHLLGRVPAGARPLQYAWRIGSGHGITHGDLLDMPGRQFDPVDTSVAEHARAARCPGKVLRVATTRLGCRHGYVGVGAADGTSSGRATECGGRQ